MAQFRLLSHPCSQRKAIFIAELNIEQHRVGLSILEYASRSSQILCAHDFMSFSLEPVTEQLAIHRVVFHN